MASLVARACKAVSPIGCDLTFALLVGQAFLLMTAHAQEVPPPGETEQPSRGELLQRVEELESRVEDLESTAVLSEPETRVRRIQVWVDENGIEYDEERPGTRPVITYQRERVYRRQLINDKIEEALDEAAAWVSMPRSRYSTLGSAAAPTPWPTATATSLRRRTCSSRPDWRSTRYSTLTSSDSAGHRPTRR